MGLWWSSEQQYEQEEQQPEATEGSPSKAWPNTSSSSAAADQHHQTATANNRSPLLGLEPYSSSSLNVLDLQQRAPSPYIIKHHERRRHNNKQQQPQQQPPEDTQLLKKIRESIIGDNDTIATPFGRRRIVYADYTASGRGLSFIEDFIRDSVLPTYANTHTESSGTGLQTTRLREDARRIIGECVNADPVNDAVIFCGSGSTAAINKLISCLGLRICSPLEDAYHLTDHIPRDKRPVVFIGPYEHHSNVLPWRESIADVVMIGQDSNGHIDQAQLLDKLLEYKSRPLKLGSFSAASNVTGIITDTCSLTDLLHAHGAFSFWDFAAAGPYVSIDMHPTCSLHSRANMDAIFLSPHKFIGGPSTPGVLVVSKQLLLNRVPDLPAGGTVEWVNPSVHEYTSDVVHREEGGTPAIIDSIRCGLIFDLKRAVGYDVIHDHEAYFIHRAINVWRQYPDCIHLLGNLDCERLSIVSFVCKAPSGCFIHHNLTVAILNDVFGIQSRGGCSCAGPYGHALLGISSEQSASYTSEISKGHQGIKPGWVRVNFNYFVSPKVVDYIIEAVRLTAVNGWKLLSQYSFNQQTGVWVHQSGVVEAPLRLNMITYEDGKLTYPTTRSTVPESGLPKYLEEANRLFDSIKINPVEYFKWPTTPAMEQEQEELRWFELPHHQ